MGLLGKFLKDKRESAGFTQAEVAYKLGYISAQFISNWERGISEFPIAKAPILARLLKVDVGAIIHLKTQDKAAQYMRQIGKNGREKKRVSRL